MKYLLEEEYEYDFRLIGISCHAQNYRVCWGINNALGLRLTRTDEDLEVLGKKSKELSTHSVYSYFDEELQNEYFLLSNRTSLGFLLPEQTMADYLLMLKEDSPLEISELTSKIRNIPFVLTTFELSVEELKSKENLIF